MQKLSVDEAVAQFQAMLRTGIADESVACAELVAAESREQAQDRHFRCAEELLRLACPDPTRCTEQRCRRGGLCRHFADLRARQRGPRRQRPSRRTPGADALRHAICVYMNSRPA